MCSGLYQKISIQETIALSILLNIWLGCDRKKEIAAHHRMW